MCEPDPLEKDMARIRQCTTIKEIGMQSDLLLAELNELKIKKLKHGFDISAEYDALKTKLALVADKREKILNKIKSIDIYKHFNRYIYQKMLIYLIMLS